MSIYCFGNTVHGELGLGGIEDEHMQHQRVKKKTSGESVSNNLYSHKTNRNKILAPRQMSWTESANLLEASCGDSHTLLLTNSGKVYSCGNNDWGQLGQEISRKRPQIVKSLENYNICQIKCGYEHSLALNEWGQVFSWGNDNQGQLGHNNDTVSQPIPKIIKDLTSKQIIQIASGYFHCIVLTNSGELYAWGSNRHGQLGLGSTTEKITKAALITSLAGIPIAFITCGANHSFAISKSGAVFGWGKNTNGELGVNDSQSKSYPVQLKTLRNRGVRFISCGEDFSVFLTLDGGVFTCGAGHFGQLGHGNTNSEILPKMVVELMGSNISQISTGRRHTLALVASRGRVYGFGLGCSGQLGNRNTNNSAVPQVVLGPWVSPSGLSLIENKSKAGNDFNNISMTVRKIFSGGDQSIVATSLYSDQIEADDFREFNPTFQMLYLTKEISKSISEVPKNFKVDLDLISMMEIVFKSQACLNGSFLLPNDGHLCCTSKHNGVDLADASEAFEYVRKIENDSIKQIVWEGITNDIIKSLLPSPPDVEALRVYLILPLYHEFVNAKNYNVLHTPFSQALERLTPIPKKIVSKWWSLTPVDYYERLVTNFKSVVLYIINFSFKPINSETNKKRITYETNLYHALNFLVFLHRINHTERTDKVSYDIFHLPELNEFVDIQQDYIHWVMDKNPNSFYLCNYPFIFDATAKTLLLQTDQAFQMHSAMQTAATQGLFSLFTFQPIPISQFVVLDVSRENLVEDTLREITQYGPNDLKKPLKVKFHDEEAEDAGGVRKEFFMLLLKDILDPKYGMFKEYTETRLMWFSDCSFEAEDMYLLIGVICGLAIYNFTIINLPFPLALYKKLLNEPVDLHDLKDLSPILAKSMQDLLDYQNDDIEDIFCLTFEITREIFGENKVIPLKENGDKILVNQQNKVEFVNLYVDYIFNKSVQVQYSAFHDGFMKVCGGRVLSIFKPHELMSVVIGNEDYDWHILEAEAEYKNGYTSGDQTIRWFWEVFHDLPVSEKKKFLLYLTGSDRIPIQGMKAIKIVFQPTADEKFLPVAHTCFNLLDLPRYSTKERLKYKLLQAIQQTQGFSLV